MASYRILYQVEETASDGNRLIIGTFDSEADTLSEISRQKSEAVKLEASLPRNWRDR